MSSSLLPIILQHTCSTSINMLRCAILMWRDCTVHPFSFFACFCCTASFLLCFSFHIPGIFQFLFSLFLHVSFQKVISKKESRQSASQLRKAKTPKYGEILTHVMSIKCGINSRFIGTPGRPDQVQCFAVCVS